MRIFFAICFLLSFSAYAGAPMSMTPIKASALGESRLGELSYLIFVLKDEDWELSHSQTLELGDCETCSRGFSGVTFLSNGLDSDPKYLGYSGFSIEIVGSDLKRLDANFVLLGKLFRKGMAEKVGTSLDSSRIPLREGEPFEIIFTIETANPFGYEKVGDGAFTGPETRKLVVKINERSI